MMLIGASLAHAIDGLGDNIAAAGWWVGFGLLCIALAIYLKR